MARRPTKNITKGYGLSAGLHDVFPSPVFSQRAPTIYDINYIKGQIWICDNPSSAAYLDVWILSDVAGGVPYWEPIGMDTEGSAPITMFVVDQENPSTADYPTIQAAINGSQLIGASAALIYVRPSSTAYTENLTLYDGLIIRGEGINTIITGVHTPPATGYCEFSKCQLTSATDIVTSAVAGTTRLRFSECYFNCTNGYVVDCANWTGPIDILSCEDGSTANGIVNAAASTVIMRGTQAGAGANVLSVVAGTLVIESSRIGCAMSPTGASTVSIAQGSWISNTITTADNLALLVTDSYLSTGANAAIDHGSTGAVTISNSTINSSANPCIAGAGAGLMTLSDITFISNAAIAGTITRNWTAEVKANKLACGDSTLRANAFTADYNVIQAYCDTTGLAAGGLWRAIRGDIRIANGDGSESPMAVRGAMDVRSGGDLEEAYGGYFNAYQQDGSAIDSNLIGLLGLAIVYETGAADQPQQWIAASQSVLMFDAAAAVPTATIVCANLNHVTYDAALNGLAHGVVVSRNGGGAGNTAGSAFKVIIGGGIVDWNYGCDLLNGGVGVLGLYGIADIRLANGALLNSNTVADNTFTCVDTGHLIVDMTDSDPGMVVNNTVDIAIAAQINGLTGNFYNAAGATVLQASGLLGYFEQADGSVLQSTATGVEGWLNLEETDIADLPTYLACGVKGYLDGAATAAVPAGMVAGVASILEYQPFMDSKAYGVLVSRLDTPGGSTGVAAQAAYGVLQGTNAIADFLYAVDLYNGATGVAYTNADIRMQNQSTIAVDTEGVTFSGDVAARSLNATNTKVTFSANPLGQLSGQAGALMTGATGTVNDLICQDGIAMQNFMIGAGQSKIIPAMEADGLEIALDLTATEGQEMNFGVLASNKHAYTIGTSPAFFFEARFKVADVSGCEPLVMGFRKQEANNGTWTAYTDYATIGIVTTQNADLITLATELNAGGTTYTNTTDAFTDGQTHTLRVNVSAAGVVTYLIDGIAPTQSAAFTFDNTDVVMPFIHLVHAAVAPGKIHLISMACGYQAWY